jgi:ArsR family transcriptional regulator, arsenate/arsenite/antimonite-responsive transcriptional repressor
MIIDVADLMKALADPNRLRILNLLHEKTLCVCDLEAILDINQSNLSRHLAKLRQAGLVTPKKKALFTYYSRAEVPGAYGPVVDALCDAVHSDPTWEKDREKLATRLKTCQSCS